MRKALMSRAIGGAALVVALAGCGKLLGISDLRATASDAGSDGAAPDASPPLDAASDAAIDAPIDAPIGVSTITGMFRTSESVSDVSQGVLVGSAPVALFRLPDNVELSHTTTGGFGAYTLTSPTLGIGAYVLGGPVGTYRPTRRYLPQTLPASVSADIDLYSENAIQAFAAAEFGLQQIPNNNFAVVVVLESNGQPAAGVHIEVPAADGAVRYSGSASQAETTNSGIAYIFNIPPQAGPITIDGVRNGVVLIGFEIDLPPQTNAHVTLQP